jgi:FkbM family methyltransferase
MAQLKTKIATIKDSDRSLRVFYRPDSSDERCLTEVVDRHCYRSRKREIDVEEGEHWLDLGANIGAFGIYCYLRGGTAECWEPVQSCFALLERNLGTLEGFELHQSAVTASKESKLLFYSGKQPNDYYRASIKPNRQPPVELKNTHAARLQKHYDGIKIDIEGAEFELIEKGLLPDCEKMVMEYHFSKDRNMTNFHRRMKALRKKYDVTYQPGLDKPWPDDIFPGFFDRFVFCKRKKKTS